jgi:magnesium transporter
MPLEIETPDLQEQFEEVIRTEDKLLIREFLDNQNISDVAELVDEYNEYASQIVSNMSIHRAASVFKILDVSIQKKVIQELHLQKQLNY